MFNFLFYRIGYAFQNKRNVVFVNQSEVLTSWRYWNLGAEDTKIYNETTFSFTYFVARQLVKHMGNRSLLSYCKLKIVIHDANTKIRRMKSVACLNLCSFGFPHCRFMWHGGLKRSGIILSLAITTCIKDAKDGKELYTRIR